MANMNPRVDLVFKKIFGIEENKDLLISLINAIVSEEDQVSDVTLLNPYNLARFKDEKLSILDIKAQGICGKKFHIEIQVTDEADYDKRALYYWAKLYTEQLKVAGDYGDLDKVIGIHILNFISILDSKKYHNAFHITEKETGMPYFNALELHTVELKKFTDYVGHQLATQIQTSLDMWSAFLTRHELLNGQQLPQSLNKPEIKKALDVLTIMHLSDLEQETYEARLKWLKIEASSLKKAEEKGRAKGLAQGIAQGIAQGEKQKALEIVKKIIQRGRSVQDIVEDTELAEEEIVAQVPIK